MAIAIDPVCKMAVDTDNPPGGQSEYGGASFYFCAPGCKVTFDQEPENYLSSQAVEWTQPKRSLFSRLFSSGSRGK